jgi:2-haloacid dehalogenase
MADIGRRNDLRWHAVLGSEIAGDFKPKPRVYLASAEALNLKPNQCMMVAAHSADLSAAAAQGLRTGHVGRFAKAGPAPAKPRRKARSMSWPKTSWISRRRWGRKGYSVFLLH